MRRRNRVSRSPAAIALAGALLACGAAGCTAFAPPPQTAATEEAPVASGNVSEAATAAAARVVAVTDPGHSRNGLGRRVQFTLLTDGAVPFTAAELDAVAEAIWRTLP